MESCSSIPPDREIGTSDTRTDEKQEHTGSAVTFSAERSKNEDGRNEWRVATDMPVDGSHHDDRSDSPSVTYLHRVLTHQD